MNRDDFAQSIATAVVMYADENGIHTDGAREEFADRIYDLTLDGLEQSLAAASGREEQP